MHIEIVREGCIGRSVEIYIDWLQFQASAGRTYGGDFWAWFSLGHRVFRIL